MASLVNFSGLFDYEEFRIADREHIVLMLQSLQREHTPVYLFFSSDSPVASHIRTVDSANGDVILAYTEQLAKVRRINTSGIFVVADHANTQIQYHVNTLAQILDSEGSDYLIPIPDSLYLIQRRTSQRRQIPERDHVICRIEMGDGTAREFPVIDISDDGLALLDIEGLLISEAGEQLGAAELRLPTGGLSLGLTVANRFAVYVPEQNQKVVRLGCHFSLQEMADQEVLNAYLQGLVTIS